MTEAEFKSIFSDIDRAAAEQRVDLSLPKNTATRWLVNERQRGKVEYKYLESGIDAAEVMGGCRNGIVRTTENGRKQIFVLKDGQLLDGYAEDYK